MNILVIGANGQIGKQVVSKIKEQTDHNPIAFVRDENQVKDFEGKGFEARLGNLESSVDDLAELFKGIDTVIFAAGSGGSTGPEKTVTVDLDGAIKTVEAAEKSGVNRYLMVSALGADNREKWNDSSIKHYYAAKHYADKALINSGLTYTIIKPGVLTNDSGTNKIVELTGKIPSENVDISREDVAQILVHSIDDEPSHNQAVNIINGDTPITDFWNERD